MIMLGFPMNFAYCFWRLFDDWCFGVLVGVFFL